MYQENYSFHTPNKDTIVWRYMDFTKFVDMLTNEQLFFCRSDKFEDPFEGIFRLKDNEHSNDMFDTFPETKKYYFLNCWHMNDHQSDAMWKIFATTNNGIAIKSSVEKIISALSKSDDEVYIGKIYYRDFANVTFLELQTETQNLVFENSWSINQFNYKRISFEHEKELRLYFIDMPIPHAIKGGIQREPLEFKKITVDLSLLIEEIVIAPFAEPWFKELVISISKKLGFDFKISTSSLYQL